MTWRFKSCQTIKVWKEELERKYGKYFMFQWAFRYLTWSFSGFLTHKNDVTGFGSFFAQKIKLPNGLHMEMEKVLIHQGWTQPTETALSLYLSNRSFFQQSWIVKNCPSFSRWSIFHWSIIMAEGKVYVANLTPNHPGCNPARCTPYYQFITPPRKAISPHLKSFLVGHL